MANVIMFIIFLMVNISMVGIFAFVYSGLEQYSEGMILGVHIPKEEINHDEVQALANQYKKNLKKFNLWNFIIGFLSCFLCFFNLSFFILLWIIWLAEYLIIGYLLICVSHRKMYDIKMKNNWVMEGNTHIVHIDTVVSAMSERLPVSHWWNIPAVTGIVVSLFLPPIRDYFGANLIQWIFPGAILLISVLLWGFHLWFIHRRNIVYSEDSSVNMAMNRMEKRTWSVLLLSVNYINLLGWSYLSIKIIINRWLYDTDYWIYIILQIIPVIIFIGGIVLMRKKRKEILTMDSAALMVDDDEYWKNGWYSNPNDSHFFVQDRMCSSNYSTNMAKPAAKVITVGTIVLSIVALIVVIPLIFSLENANITFQVDARQVTIDASIYDTDFSVSEIQSVKILDQMPVDDFIRTNGGDTDQYLIGHFKGKETGKCLMYLYRDYYPILQIKLKDKTIYINSKKENDVEKWYQELKY